MDELACFASGMLALGSSGFAPEEAKNVMSLSEEVHSFYDLVPRSYFLQRNSGLLYIG